MVKWVKKVDEFPQKEPIKEFWNPTSSGEEFVGVLERVVHNKGLNKNNNLYLFRNEDGELIGVMGTEQLNRTLPVLVGKKIMLVYRGKFKSKKSGFQFKAFDIFIDEDYKPEEYINELDIQY